LTWYRRSQRGAAGAPRRQQEVCAAAGKAWRALGAAERAPFEAAAAETRAAWARREGAPEGPLRGRPLAAAPPPGASPEPEPRVATPAGAAAWPRPPSAPASAADEALFEFDFEGAGDAEGALLPLPLAGGDPWSLDDLLLR